MKRRGNRPFVGMGLAALALAVVLPALAGVPQASASDLFHSLRDPFFTYTRPGTFTSLASTETVPWKRGTLDCALWRPGDGAGNPAKGKFPAILADYQAYSGANVTLRVSDAYDALVTRGYGVMQCNPPGTGHSTGELDPFGPDEQQGAYDAIEWLGTRNWSDGNIGMQGSSYGAHSALEVALLRPPHLKTIIPLNGISDWYENTIYHGGILSPTIWEWELAVVPALAAGSTNPLLVPQQYHNTFNAYRQHPLHDNFWAAHGCIRCNYSHLTLPILELAGWNDRYKDGMIENFVARPQNIKLVLGPWTHASTTGSTAGGTVNQTSVQLAWYDHYLRHMDSAPVLSAPVTALQMPEVGGDGWHRFTTWPPVGHRVVRLFLNADHSLSATPSAPGRSTFVDNPSDSGCDPSSSAACAPNQAQADLSAFRSTYTTGTLSQDLVLAGATEATIKASFPSPDPHLVARLSDVTDGNSSTQIAGGWRRVQLRNGYRKVSGVTPGKTYAVPVHVYPQFYRFPKGHRIRISLSSGDLTDASPDDGGGGQVSVAVGRGGSYIDIPVLEGGTALAPTSTAQGRSGRQQTGQFERAGGRRDRVLAMTGAGLSPALGGASLLLVGGLLWIWCRRAPGVSAAGSPPQPGASLERSPDATR